MHCRHVFLEVCPDKGVYLTPSFSFKTIVFFNWDEFLRHISKSKSNYVAGFILREDEHRKRYLQAMNTFNKSHGHDSRTNNSFSDLNNMVWRRSNELQ